MKYLVRYFYGTDKTRFFETTIEVVESRQLVSRLDSLMENNPGMVIQKIVRNAA
jgi:hypothetical protein